jgi:phospholipase/lecithinase/hemolysin
LLLDPASFVVVLFVGTNDVGIGSFATNNESPSATLDEVAACQIDSIRHLYALGARNFILNSMTPLQNTKTFSTVDSGSCYYGSSHNGTALHDDITSIVSSMNSILQKGVDELNNEWNGNGSVAWFDTYGFFEELYNNPAPYFNGSVPAVVNTPCSHCDGT